MVLIALLIISLIVIGIVLLSKSKKQTYKNLGIIIIVISIICIILVTYYIIRESIEAKERNRQLEYQIENGLFDEMIK